MNALTASTKSARSPREGAACAPRSARGASLLGGVVDRGGLPRARLRRALGAATFRTCEVPAHQRRIVDVAAERPRKVLGVLEENRNDARLARRLDAVARPGHAERADELVARPEDGCRHRRGFGIALAERGSVHALADLVEALAARAAEGAQHMAGGAHGERQAVADLDRIAHRARGLDAVQADSL